LDYARIEVGSKANPWTILNNLKNEGHIDVTIVKLDIDTPSIENPLVDQVFLNGTVNLIDEFYYEHHVANSR